MSIFFILLIEFKQHPLFAPFPGLRPTFPQRGQATDLTAVIILPPPGEGCPQDRKGALKRLLFNKAELTR